MKEGSIWPERVFGKFECRTIRLCVRLVPLLATLILPPAAGARGAARPTPITVAVTNPAYASIAKAVGGTSVRTVVWQTDSKDQRDCPSAARIIIDGSGTGGPTRQQVRRMCHGASLVILARDFVEKKSVVQTAFWYSPGVVPKLSNVLAAELIRLEPSRRARLIHNLSTFMLQLQPAYSLWARTADRTRQWSVATRGSSATALASALHMHIVPWAHNGEAQPLPRDLNAVIYDSGTGDGARSGIVAKARRRGITTVAIEAQPAPSEPYPRWLYRQLERLFARTSGDKR